MNRHIKSCAGGDFTAKDFRTWNATVLAAVALASGERAATRAQRDRAVREAVKMVSAYLGNTPAVCRASYLDPRVIDRFQAGVTIAPALRALPAREPDLSDERVRKRIERAVVELIA